MGTNHPPTSAARRAVVSRTDLRIGDTVHDPVGGTTGRVVDLTPLGWTDDPRERVTVAWHPSGWRSDPVVTGLEVRRPRCTLCGRLPEDRCSCFAFPRDALRNEPEATRAGDRR